MATLNITNIPAPRVPFVDERSGLISREWYRFLLNLFTLVGGGQNNTSLDDTLLGPPIQNLDEVDVQSVELASVGVESSQVALVAELQKQLDALMLLPQFQLGTMAALQQDSVPFLTFDTTPFAVPSNVPGTLFWDSADGNQTLSLVMANGTTTQQIGEEQFYRIKATSAITNGQVIMFTGSVGASGGLKGAPATGLLANTASYVMGVATENIALNGWGYVTSFGLVRGINTTGGAEAWVDGQILYLDPTVAGGLTKILPTAPNPKVIVAAVTYAATNGSLFIRPTFGGKLGDYEGDVDIVTPVVGNILQYDGSAWKNVVFSSVGVVSVGATAPVVSSGGSAPVISIPAATALVDGYLTSTDWSTFNGKQPAGAYVTSISIASANGLAGTSSGGVTPALTLSTSITGILKGNGTAISAATAGTDYLVPSAPVTKTADFTVAAGETWLINNKSGSTCTVTLPAAASNTGRSLTFKNTQAQLLVSASSNVAPIDSVTPGTSILLAVAGNWATMISDGTNWVIMQQAPNNILLLE